MKLLLINEATVDQVQNRIPVWINKYFNGNQEEANKIIPEIIQADPTNGKYSEWLIRQWKNKTAIFPEDNEKLHKNLELFTKKQSKLEDKDINSYTPASLAKTLQTKLNLTKSERKEARKGGIQLPPGADIVINDGERVIVKITDAKAASILSSGTEWCTANIKTAEEYISQGPLYLFYLNGERQYLVHIEQDQFMDIYDERVDDRFELLDELSPVIGDWKEDPHWIYTYAHEYTGDRIPELEHVVLSDPGVAVDYAINVIDGRWPKLENIIFKDGQHAYWYALYVIQDRWKKAEPYIMKNPSIAYLYAENVIQGRWPEAEPYMMQDPEIILKYAKDIINGRWPEAESKLINHPDLMKDYKKSLSV